MTDFVRKIYKSLLFFSVGLGAALTLSLASYLVGYFIWRYVPSLLTDELLMQLRGADVIGPRSLLGGFMIFAGCALYAWFHETGKLLVHYLNRFRAGLKL